MRMCVNPHLPETTGKNQARADTILAWQLHVCSLLNQTHLQYELLQLLCSCCNPTRPLHLVQAFLQLLYLTHSRLMPGLQSAAKCLTGMQPFLQHRELSNRQSAKWKLL